jgi:hypothetical protein
MTISKIVANSLGGNLTLTGNTAYTGTLTGGTGIINIGSGQFYKDANGNIGIGTSSPTQKLNVSGSANLGGRGSGFAFMTPDWRMYNSSSGNAFVWDDYANERMRITSGGDLLVGKTAEDIATVGGEILASGRGRLTFSGGTVLEINRLASDGTLVAFYQASTLEGTITVSGTTVSYNGGHLSRWAQTTTAKDESLVKGTVLSNLDDMNVYVDADGNPVQNEQLNKVKVSDVEGDANVAGVFVSWTHDEHHNVDEINMAMTGDMIIRIAQGVTVQRGDLLMSAGDGTAKPQGDDIVRSKTIAKVTSTHVTCTYADGSFCVPCVLMAC